MEVPKESKFDETIARKKLAERKSSFLYLHGIVQSVRKVQLLVLNALD